MPFASVRKVALAVLACSLIAGAATCKAPPSTHTVPIDGLAFQPPALTVKVGDSIVWINKDLVPHTATAASGTFDSGKIEAQNSWKYTIRTSGRFSYACAYHPTMTGLVAVK